MKIYHLEFAKTGTGVSGGEISMLESIKYFKSKGLKNILLTTDNGKETYEKLGLAEDGFLEYRIIKSFDQEKKHHIFISYVLRTLDATKAVRRLKVEDDDALFCHSDFFPNSIPFFLLARKNSRAKLFYWFHMLAPDILKGFEGHFTGKLQFPKLNGIHYKLSQYLYIKLMAKRGVIITINDYYKKILENKRQGSNIYVIKKFGGIDALYADHAEKKYDLAWMGRFHPQKGLFEALDILEKLKQEKNDIKLLVIGDGDKGIEEKFMALIRDKKLGKNIIYKRFVAGSGRYVYLREAKIFLMTSYYESYGLVNIEAMKCGLPVVAYKLPVFEVFKKGMITVDILDNKGMRNAILKLLNDENYLKKMSDEALDFSNGFSWGKTGEEVYNCIMREPRHGGTTERAIVPET